MAILDITDENNAMNKENICEDSCIDYSIGYLHHLVKVKELLEPILLTQHNLDQMENFFALLREMKSDTARLSNLLNLIEAYFLTFVYFQRKWIRVKSSKKRVNLPPGLITKTAERMVSKSSRRGLKKKLKFTNRLPSIRNSNFKSL